MITKLKIWHETFFFAILLSIVAGLLAFLLKSPVILYATPEIVLGFLLGAFQMREVLKHQEEEEELKHVASPPRSIRTPRVSYRRQR